MARIVRATLIGGVLFLVPLAFVLLALGHAWRLAKQASTPLHKLVPTDTVAGMVGVDALVVLILLAVCLLAGIAARHSLVSGRMGRLDSLLIDVLPGYAIAKSTLGGMARGEEVESALSPVLVRFDDHAMLAFEIERDEAAVVLFLPGSPTAWSGSTILVEPDRVTPLALPVHEVQRVIRVLGRGTIETLDRERSAGTEPRDAQSL